MTNGSIDNEAKVERCFVVQLSYECVSDSIDACVTTSTTTISKRHANVKHNPPSADDIWPNIERDRQHRRRRRHAALCCSAGDGVALKREGQHDETCMKDEDVLVMAASVHSGVHGHPEYDVLHHRMTNDHRHQQAGSGGSEHA